MVKEESRQSTFSLQDKVAPLPRNKKAAFVSSGSITNRTTPMPPPRRATSQQRFVFILYYFFSRFMFDFVKSPFFNRPHSFQLSHVFFSIIRFEHSCECVSFLFLFNYTLLLHPSILPCVVVMGCGAWFLSSLEFDWLGFGFGTTACFQEFIVFVSTANGCVS